MRVPSCSKAAHPSGVENWIYNKVVIESIWGWNDILASVFQTDGLWFNVCGWDDLNEITSDWVVTEGLFYLFHIITIWRWGPRLAQKQSSKSSLCCPTQHFIIFSLWTYYCVVCQILWCTYWCASTWLARVLPYGVYVGDAENFKQIASQTKMQQVYAWRTQ